MDDDITFGASVWGSNDLEPANVLAPPSHNPEVSQLDDDAFEQFDDFGPPADSSLNDNDDFEFGDFGEAEFVEPANFVDDGEFGVAGPSSQREWRPLNLDPIPSRSELEDEIYEILEPIWDNENIADCTTDEGIREVEGISQILLTPESRELYKQLLQTSPPTKPPNWTRSRIRRQHLITLGIPINLDEVLPRANGKPMPTLEITTRPMSAPPVTRNPPHTNSTVSSTTQSSRAGTPQPGGQTLVAQLGPKPELDIGRINKLLALDQESLSLQPLSNVERYLADIKMQTANTSNLLTYLLQTRDALQQDSETYNGLIAEMVGEAQKLKSGKPARTSSVKRGSTFN